MFGLNLPLPLVKNPVQGWNGKSGDVGGTPDILRIHIPGLQNSSILQLQRENLLACKLSALNSQTSLYKVLVLTFETPQILLGSLLQIQIPL